MSGEFSYWNLVGCFLEFDDLLIDELRIFVNNNVRVHRASIISWGLNSITVSWKRDSSKSTCYGKNLDLMTVSALDIECCRFGR